MRRSQIREGSSRRSKARIECSEQRRLRVRRAGCRRAKLWTTLSETRTWCPFSTFSRFGKRTYEKESVHKSLIEIAVAETYRNPSEQLCPIFGQSVERPSPFRLLAAIAAGGEDGDRFSLDARDMSTIHKGSNARVATAPSQAQSQYPQLWETNIPQHGVSSTGIPGVDGDQRGQLNMVSVLLAELGWDLCEDHIK